MFPLRRRSHITKLRGVLQAFEEPQAVNAETVIDLAAGEYPSMGGRLCHGRNGLRAYELHPLTGKTHQLRVHMNSIGVPIHGDDFYPRIVERAYDDFSTPLELVARSLRFTDPVSGEPARIHLPHTSGLVNFTSLFLLTYSCLGGNMKLTSREVSFMLWKELIEDKSERTAKTIKADATAIGRLGPCFKQNDYFHRKGTI